MTTQYQRWTAESDNEILLTDIRDRATGALLTAATVTAEVRSDEGVLIPGSQISLTPVSGKPGQFRGIMPAAVGLQASYRYDVIVTVLASAGRTRTFRVRVKVEYA